MGCNIIFFLKNIIKRLQLVQPLAVITTTHHCVTIAQRLRNDCSNGCAMVAQRLHDGCTTVAQPLQQPCKSLYSILKKFYNIK